MYVYCVREHFTASQFLSTEELGTTKSKTVYFKFEKTFLNISQKVDESGWIFSQHKATEQILK